MKRELTRTKTMDTFELDVEYNTNITDKVQALINWLVKAKNEDMVCLSANIWDGELDSIDFDAYSVNIETDAEYRERAKEVLGNRLATLEKRATSINNDILTTKEELTKLRIN
jgi:hypothetical protein